MPRRRRTFDDRSLTQSNLVERGFCHALGKFGICFGGIWPALDRPRELRQRRRYDCGSFGIDLSAYGRVRPKTARSHRLSLRQFAAAFPRQTVAFTLELQGPKGYTDLASVSVLVTTLGEKGTRSVRPLPHWGKVKMTEQAREWLASYYGAIQRVDYFVEKVLTLLEAYGHAEDTLVIFSADHGPSDLHRGKTTSYEFGIRVPFIVKWPGVVKPGSRSEALVSFVDLMPTFLEAAGLAKPTYLPGKSILPALTGERPKGDRKLLYSAYNSHTTGMKNFWPARTVTDGRFKLIHNLLGDGKTTRPGENGSSFSIIKMMEASEAGRTLIQRTATPPAYELYDLTSDPGELIDLAGNPKYKGIEEDLKASLTHWRKDIVADPLSNPATLKEFTEEYMAHCEQWEAKSEAMGGSKAMRKKGWALNKSRWIPVWDAAPYKSEP